MNISINIAAEDASVLRSQILNEGQTMSWSEVLTGWRDAPAFRRVFIDMLAAAPWESCYWETPAVSAGTLREPFEFVLVDSPLLAGVAPEPEVFREHFTGPDTSDGIAVFPNLGGDAVLVAPCPGGAGTGYAHLADFCRSAPIRQQHALWVRVAEAMLARLERPDPVWLSTAGQGVYWLHVRLDDRPKYYSYQPYRRPPSG